MALPNLPHGMNMSLNPAKVIVSAKMKGNGGLIVFVTVCQNSEICF